MPMPILLATALLSTTLSAAPADGQGQRVAVVNDSHLPRATGQATVQAARSGTVADQAQMSPDQKPGPDIFLKGATLAGPGMPNGFRDAISVRTNGGIGPGTPQDVPADGLSTLRSGAQAIPGPAH